MVKEKCKQEITAIIGIAKGKYVELAKRIQHNRVDAKDMSDLIKMSIKGYDTEAIAVGYLLGRVIADNDNKAHD